MTSELHQLERRERSGKWFMALAMLLAISVLAASWLGLFAWMSTTAAHGTFVDVEDKYIPDVQGEVLNFPNLSQVSRVYAANGTLLAELHDGRVSEPTRFEDIPDQVVYAVLGAEDSDFFEHEGVDYSAIFSAALDNLRTDSQRGGSTITQQVVKKTFVGDELTIERKIREAVTALELERRYTKEEILEYYLNSVYFGSNAYGVAAAANEFFQKDLEELTIAEAATIAVLPRNPTEYNPRRNHDLVLERRNDVIVEMEESGFITAEAAEAALASPMVISDHVASVSRAAHVVAEVKRRLLSEPEFSFLGETRDQRKVAIFGCPADDTTCSGGGGLNIYTTIDLDLQDSANTILQNWLPAPEDPSVDAPTGAIAMVEAANGAVRVIASGLPFEDEQFDLAVQGRRNPGSSFKPFALVAALESGISLNSWWDSSSPKDVQCPYVCSDRGNVWRVSNAGGGNGGLQRLFEATYRSVNTVYAQVAVTVGPDHIVDAAHRMGVESELAAVPSIALGAGAVSPLEMASAYTNFATNGVWAKPFLVERIVATDGSSIYQHEVNKIQTIDATIAAAVRQPLEVVPVSGTAPAANIGRPQGGKTGTHQNYMEAWFVGFVPQYSTAVWVGYPKEQIPLTNVTIGGRTYSRVFGGTVPAPIWKEFMQIALADVPVAQFPEAPTGTQAHFAVPKTTVPDVVGQSQGAASAALLNAHLRVAVVEVASLEPEGTVIAQAPSGGATVEQGTSVSISVSTGQPPGGPMPKVLWLPLAEAQSRLAAWESENDIDITVVIERTTDPKEAAWGKVVAQNPPQGTHIENGAVVVLTVADPP